MRALVQRKREIEKPGREREREEGGAANRALERVNFEKKGKIVGFFFDLDFIPTHSLTHSCLAAAAAARSQSLSPILHLNKHRRRRR